MTNKDLILGIMFLPAMIYKCLGKPIWLFSSRLDEPDGNALALYHWIKNKKSKEKVYFVLDNSSPRFSPDMVKWGSFKHLFYSLVCEAVLFDAENCNDISHNFKRKMHLKEYKCFLQHGVIVSFIPGYIYSETTFDLVVCTNWRELMYLRDVYKYPEYRLALTGLARHDDLIRNKKDNRYIFIAPTWRKNLNGLTEEDFVKTEYYIRWNSLLKRINEFAKEIKMKIRFKLHYMFTGFQSSFMGWEDNGYFETESVHELIRDCSLLITDYSSVSTDAALIHKPVLYYQFDYADYRNFHQSEGYFDYLKDGFGTIVKDENSLMNKVREMWTGGSFINEEKYILRSDSFFEYHDKNNCQRNYDAIRQYIQNHKARSV